MKVIHVDKHIGISSILLLFGLFDSLSDLEEKEYELSQNKRQRSVGIQAEYKNEEPLKIVSTFYNESSGTNLFNKQRNASLLFLAAASLVYLVLYYRPELHEVSLISHAKL